MIKEIALVLFLGFLFAFVGALTEYRHHILENLLNK